MSDRFVSYATPEGRMDVDQKTGAVRIVQDDGQSRIVPWPGTEALPAEDWPAGGALTADEEGRSDDAAPHPEAAAGPPEGSRDEPESPPSALGVWIAGVGARAHTVGSRAWAWVGTEWVALVVLFAAVTAPLLLRHEEVFLAGLNGDMVATIWFYDLVGRSLPVLPTELTAFNFPDPVPVAREFPSVVDAVLAGPLLRFRGWVAGWGSVQTMLLGLNVAGAVALAHAAGARGAGLFVAGALALLCRQFWFDLSNGRMNAAWPGLGLLAAGCVLRVVAADLPRWRRVCLTLLAAVLGALMAWIYPPQLVLLAPVALVLMAGPAWRHPKRLGWVLAAVVLALVGSKDALSGLAATRTFRVCGEVGCSDVFHTLPLERLAMVRPATTGLNETGMFFTSWVLLPLALFHPRRRVLLTGAAMLVPLVFLSIGPCPQAFGDAVVWARTLERLGSAWCLVEGLTDYGRAATIAGLCAAVLSGLALDALPWPRVRWGVGLAVAVGSVGLLVPSYTDFSKWARPGVLPLARFLQTASPGPIAELPYDMAGQYRSALDAPDRRRRNPLKPVEESGSSDPVLTWVDALGRGRQPAAPGPTAADLAETELRWVFFDPSRCQQFGVHCVPDTPQQLGALLGPPETVPGSAVLAWELPSGAPGDPTAP